MPFRRAIVALVLLGTACAPSPSLDGSGPVPTPAPLEIDQSSDGDADPPDDRSTDTTPTTTVPAGSEPPVGPAIVDGRIASHDTIATIRTGEDRIDLDTGELPSQPTWSRDGTRLITVSLDGPVPVVDVVDGATGEPLHRTFAERLYFFFSWSHDGSRIAALGPGVLGTTLDILDADGGLLQSAVVDGGSVFVAWEPGGDRLVVHADEDQHRLDPDGSIEDLGRVGGDFFAPKWIPGTAEILIVADIEGTPTLVRRGVERGDPMTSFGPVVSAAGIAVNPDGRLAAISTTFPAGGAGGRRTSTGPLRQTPQALSGLVEVVDLATGVRTPILDEFAMWTEWNDDGTRLLISAHDSFRESVTWWIHEPGPDDEDPALHPVTSFIPAPVFFRSYMVFADQFIEQPRLWSPAGDTFVFAASTPDGSEIQVASTEENAEPVVVGQGEVGFWSPSD